MCSSDLGTENVPSIIGLGKACELAKKFMSEETTRVKQLRDKLEDEILKKAPDPRVNGHRTQRLPNTTNMSFEFVEGEAILLLFRKRNLCLIWFSMHLRFFGTFACTEGYGRSFYGGTWICKAEFKPV